MRAVKQVRGPSPCLHSILSSEQMEPVPPVLVAARACIRSFGLGILSTMRMWRALVRGPRHTLGRNAAERTCSEPVPHRFINGESDRPREGCERCYFGRMSKATSDRRSNYRVRSRDLFRTKAYVAAIFCSVRFCIKQLFVPLDSLSAIICSVSLFQVARFVFFDST